MQFIKNWYHYVLAWLGNIVYLFPSRKIYIIGITGTKGKSTVVELLNAILEGAGKKTATLSSIHVRIAGKREENITETTMPGRFFIKKFLRNAVSAGCEYAIIEVTSEGIIQHRHQFIDFDAVLFLNIHPEHIESHGSYEAYRAAKLKFFTDVAKPTKKKKFFFINKRDKEAHLFVNAAGVNEVIYFDRETFTHTCLKGKRNALGLWLAYDFNLENAAAASTTAQNLGLSWDQIEKSLKTFSGLQGRMDIVQEAPYKIIVDYAHTPDSLEAVYKSLAGPRRKKLICVFGSCGGGRDKWKRPVLGNIASQYCKSVILTDEDPYDENPELIISQIASGLSEKHKKLLKNPKQTEGVWKLLDRRGAITKAKSIAKKGDILVITGKGSEQWIHVKNGKRIPWSDREAALGE
jgi:UDP-N-acetylmuramoyl-L-alanyl-D-glutamate--2,6-diaminopimelate ligase